MGYGGLLVQDTNTQAGLELMNSALNLLSVGITGLSHHIWLQLFALFNKGFHSLAQAGLKLTMLSTQAGFKLSAILLPRSPEC